MEARHFHVNRPHHVGYFRPWYQNAWVRWTFAIGVLLFVAALCASSPV